MGEGSSSGSKKKLYVAILSGLILVVLVGLLLGPITPGIPPGVAWPNVQMQVARQIGLVLFAYATDHGGKYPTGKSSTEIFQKLIDEGYVSDPTIFFVEWLKIPGKTKATSNKLKPENVCWDVTIPVDSTSSNFLPLVFATGYGIDYVAGGTARPRVKSSYKEPPGLAVYYKGNSASFLLNDNLPDGIVTNFIPASFVPNGKKYQQLTPDGALAP